MAKNSAQMERIMSLMGSLDQHSMTESIQHKNTNVDKSNFEYQMVGGDGKSYAIVREGKYYYIKSADASKKNLAEAYDYLGGWMNRKNFEYNSYAKALKNFELKMRSINEAFGRDTKVEAMNSAVNHALMESEAVSMGSEISRIRQIMTSSNLIMESGYGYKPGTTEVPEAPKKNSGSKDGPFTEKASANLDKDFKKTAGEPDNQSEPFGDGKAPAKGKDVNDSDIPTDGKAVAVANPKGGKVTRVNEECETGEAENGVISDKMKNWGIKDHGHGVITVDKADMDSIHIGTAVNEELDTDFDAGVKGVGTGEIGDDAPFDEKAQNDLDECGMNPMGEEPICEEDEIPTDEGDEEPVDTGADEDLTDGLEPVDGEDAEGEEMPEDDTEGEYAEDDEEMPEDDTEGEYAEDDEEMPEDDAEGEYSEDEEEMPEEGDELDELRAEIEDLKAQIAELKGEDEEMPEDDAEGEYAEGDEEMPEEGDEVNSDMDSDEEPMLGEDETLNEAKQRYMNSIVNNVVSSILKENKTVLHDFGKHTGYRKKVMSLPQTGEDKNEHGKDWNDDSVYSEEPFGNKIGSSAPFDKAVKMITDSIMESLKKK